MDLQQETVHLLTVHILTSDLTDQILSNIVEKNPVSVLNQKYIPAFFVFIWHFKPDKRAYMASQESNKYPNDWKHHIMDIFTS
jgi:hypothetical protein